jgi:hypothetical protein
MDCAAAKTPCFIRVRGTDGFGFASCVVGTVVLLPGEGVWRSVRNIICLLDDLNEPEVWRREVAKVWKHVG